MTTSLPPCPTCSSPYTYELGALLVCPECAHEWAPASGESTAAGDSHDSIDEPVIKDAVGKVLTDGDAVTIVRDLKVKGSSTSIKVGTKVRGIRLITPVDGHDIEAKVDGFGVMKLKSSVVKKS